MRSQLAVSGTLAMLLSLAACGSGPQPGDDAGGAAEPVASVAAVPDACELLRSMDLAPYLSGPATEFKESIRQDQPRAGATMCSASPAGGLPLLTLMLRWGPDDADPRTVEEWIIEEWAADTAEIPGMAEELRTAEAIPGLGDFAVAYSFGGERISAYWKSRFHLTTTANSFGDKSLARQALEAVAREAIARF